MMSYSKRKNNPLQLKMHWDTQRLDIYFAVLYQLKMQKLTHQLMFMGGGGGVGNQASVNRLAIIGNLFLFSAL